MRGNGHVHVAVDLACEQSSRGNDVMFASNGGTYVSLLNSNGVRHVCINQDMPSSIKGALRLFKLMRHERPNIVHAHMMAAAAMGFVATRLYKGALVTTVHNSFDRHSALMRLGDQIVAVSEAERKLLLERGYNKNKLNMVYNGPIGSIRESLDPDGVLEVPRPCIMTLSGLHKRKRVGDALFSFSLIEKDFPDWRFVVVGSGPDKDDLKLYTRQLGISEKVVFAGDSIMPKNLLQQASVFVALSEAEPFGLAVAEARAAGCAIIVSNVGGMPEVVENGLAGIIVGLGDTSAISNAFADLIKNPKNLNRWQIAASSNAAKFSVSRMTDGYEVVYNAAISDRNFNPN